MIPCIPLAALALAAAVLTTSSAFALTLKTTDCSGRLQCLSYRPPPGGNPRGHAIDPPWINPGVYWKDHDDWHPRIHRERHPPRNPVPF